MKYVLLTLLVAGVLCGNVPAASGMPGASVAPGSRFSAADSDKDGFLSQVEFGAAFPGLKREAFSIIDTDKDERISAEEWRLFNSGHGKGGGNAYSAPMPGVAGSGGDVQTGDGQKNDVLPLLPLPQGRETPPTQAASGTPTLSSGNEPQSGGLPLLSPPGK